MPVLTTTLYFDQGADYQSAQYVWLQGPTLEDVQPVDLTACTATLTGRVNPSDLAPLLSLSTTGSADGVIALGGITGTVQFSVTHSRTALLPAAIYYNLKITFPSGLIIPFLSGELLTAPAF